LAKHSDPSVPLGLYPLYVSYGACTSSIAEETAVQAHTQEAMEADALAPAAENGGIKHKREEEGKIHRPSGPRPPPVPTTDLIPGGIEAQAQPAEPLNR